MQQDIGSKIDFNSIIEEWLKEKYLQQIQTQKLLGESQIKEVMNQIYDNLNTLANNKEFIICKSVGQELCERKLIELSSEMMEDVNKDLQAIDQFIKFKRLLLRSIMNFASKYLDKSKQMMLVHELQEYIKENQYRIGQPEIFNLIFNAIENKNTDQLKEFIKKRFNGVEQPQVFDLIVQAIEMKKTDQLKEFIQQKQQEIGKFEIFEKIIKAIKDQDHIYKLKKFIKLKYQSQKLNLIRIAIEQKNTKYLNFLEDILPYLEIMFQKEIRQVMSECIKSQLKIDVNPKNLIFPLLQFIKENQFLFSSPNLRIITRQQIEDKYSKELVTQISSYFDFYLKSSSKTEKDMEQLKKMCYSLLYKLDSKELNIQFTQAYQQKTCLRLLTQCYQTQQLEMQYSLEINKKFQKSGVSYLLNNIMDNYFNQTPSQEVDLLKQISKQQNVDVNLKLLNLDLWADQVCQFPKNFSVNEQIKQIKQDFKDQLIQQKQNQFNQKYGTSYQTKVALNLFWADNYSIITLYDKKGCTIYATYFQAYLLIRHDEKKQLTLNEIKEETNLNEQFIQDNLNQLIKHGFILHQENSYLLNDNFTPNQEFYNLTRLILEKEKGGKYLALRLQLEIENQVQELQKKSVEEKKGKKQVLQSLMDKYYIMDKKAMNDLEDYMIDELELKTKINDIWKMQKKRKD